MLVAFALLLAAAVAIYLSCEFFVNGIEWVGHRFGVSQTATGSVLAAFGTALPESVVTFVAVVFGKSPAETDLGVGAAIGGPLALSTLAYAVVGLVFITSAGTRSSGLFTADTTHRLINDQQWFLSIFMVKIVLGLIAFAVKPWLGLVFLAAYALYVRQELQRTGDAESDHETLEPLRIRRTDRNPAAVWAVLQTAGAVVVIFLASQLFVHQLAIIGPALGIPAQLVALLLSPIATELPEILNAIIWVRQGKQNLALANISGAMMIQATIPSALGLFFTPWLLGHALIWAAVITLLSIIGLYLLLRRNLLTGARLAWFGALYLVFAAGLYFIPLQ